MPAQLESMVSSSVYYSSFKLSCHSLFDCFDIDGLLTQFLLPGTVGRLLAQLKPLDTSRLWMSC